MEAKTFSAQKQKTTMAAVKVQELWQMEEDILEVTLVYLALQKNKIKRRWYVCLLNHMRRRDRE